MKDVIDQIQFYQTYANSLRRRGDELVAESHTIQDKLKKQLRKMTLVQLKAALSKVNPNGVMKDGQYKSSANKPWGAAPNMQVYSSTPKGLYIEALLLEASLRKR